MEQAARVDRALSGVELLYAEANWAGDDLTRWLAARHVAPGRVASWPIPPTGRTRSLTALVRDVIRAADAAEADQRCWPAGRYPQPESDDPAAASPTPRLRGGVPRGEHRRHDRAAGRPRAQDPATRAVRVALAARAWTTGRPCEFDGSMTRMVHVGFTEIARLADPDPWRNRLHNVPRISSLAPATRERRESSPGRHGLTNCPR